MLYVSLCADCLTEVMAFVELGKRLLRLVELIVEKLVGADEVLDGIS